MTLTRMRDSLTDLAEITRTRARREATVSGGSPPQVN